MQDSSILLLVRKLGFMLQLEIISEDLLRWQAFPGLLNVVGLNGTQMFMGGNI